MKTKPFCPQDSRIKLSIMTKPGELNETWYSPLKQNNKPIPFIINGMKRRFLKSKYTSITQVLMFFDNQSRELIEKHVQ